CQQHYRYPYSF
nr:immunoglobulin light chain junction region [Macaca mulatta]MOW73858.1 immunoglobulin light chain junction region [Macaca mulatta]